MFTTLVVMMVVVVAKTSKPKGAQKPTNQKAWQSKCPTISLCHYDDCNHHYHDHYCRYDCYFKEGGGHMMAKPKQINKFRFWETEQKPACIIIFYHILYKCL